MTNFHLQNIRAFLKALINLSAKINKLNLLNSFLRLLGTLVIASTIHSVAGTGSDFPKDKGSLRIKKEKDGLYQFEATFPSTGLSSLFAQVQKTEEFDEYFEAEFFRDIKIQSESGACEVGHREISDTGYHKEIKFTAKCLDVETEWLEVEVPIVKKIITQPPFELHTSINLDREIINSFDISQDRAGGRLSLSFKFVVFKSILSTLLPTSGGNKVVLQQIPLRIIDAFAFLPGSFELFFVAIIVSLTAASWRIYYFSWTIFSVLFLVVSCGSLTWDGVLGYMNFCKWSSLVLMAYVAFFLMMERPIKGLLFVSGVAGVLSGFRFGAQLILFTFGRSHLNLEIFYSVLVSGLLTLILHCIIFTGIRYGCTRLNSNTKGVFLHLSQLIFILATLAAILGHLLTLLKS